MSGIVFFRTENRATVVEWYQQKLEADIWLEQPGCTILHVSAFRFGFCDSENTETEAILTFLCETKAAVNSMHERLGEAVREEPHENSQYRIYQFFAEDPDGRDVEIQTFLHQTPTMPE
jgi:hypothetical protein